MNTTYRVSFVACTTEATAREAVEGINGGDAFEIRTADVGGTVTAWFTVETGREKWVDAELVADARVDRYSW
jgi:hypothetical protein